MQSVFPYCRSPPLLMGTRIIEHFVVSPPGNTLVASPQPPLPENKLSVALLKSIPLLIGGPLT